MKKREPARLYPEKEDITIKNFIIENQQLVILIILIVIFLILIFTSIFFIDFFRGEHYYNYL